jgi:hypothetical protein
MTEEFPTPPAPDDLTDTLGALTELGVGRTTLERLIVAGRVTVYRQALNPRARWFSIAELRALKTFTPSK